MALQVLTQILSRAGYKVRQLATPIGATRMILRKEIDAVVIDFNMPAIRGDKLARLLRSTPRMSELPIVIVSAETADTLQSALEGLSNVHYVMKRDVRTKLPSTLEAALNAETDADASA